MADIKMPELTKEQQQMVVAVVLFAGVLGFVYFKYFWSPISARIMTAEKKIEKVNNDIKKAEAQEKRFNRLKKEVEELKKERATAERRLPKEKNIPDLIYMLTDLGRKYNVEMHSISSGQKKKQKYFAEIAYRLSITGSYHSIGRFLTALGTSERIFSARNLTFSGTAPSLSASFSLIAYQYGG